MIEEDIEAPLLEAEETDARVVWEIPDDEVQWEDLQTTWADRKDDDVMNLIIQGRDGLNMGMKNGLTHINTYVHGTHRGRYILIGAESGVGKTTIADFMYVYSLWMDCRRQGKKLYIKYFSYEISAAEKKLKWIVQWIKHVYHIDLSTDYISGRIPGLTISDEHLKMVMRGYGIVEEVMKDVQIFDHMLHPTGMLNRLIEEHYEKIGDVRRAEAKEGKKGYILGYKPHDPAALTVIITDHLALINTEKGANTKKDIMDRWSVYSVQLRNIFGATLVQIQQFNTDQMKSYRDAKKSDVSITPQRLDFGDSTYTFRDADLVFGLVKPVQYNLPVYYGFNLEELGQSFVGMHLMKNRYGPAGRMVPLFMNPISGMFYDLPLSPMMRQSNGELTIKFYTDESKRIEALCQQFSSPLGTNQ